MLDFHIPTFIFAAINLVVIYLILKKLLFVPVTAFMEKRKAKIVDAFKDADNEKRDAKKKYKEYEDMIHNFEFESKQAYEKEMEKAREEYQSIIKSAKEEAERIRKQGFNEIDREREMLKKDIKDQVAKLAVRIASKLMKENMDTKKNNDLVTKYLDEEDVA